jgi:UDP-N-acetylmuramoylalanine--D-glutamate ligase
VNASTRTAPVTADHIASGVFLVYGLGVTGRAVAAALIGCAGEVRLADDRPDLEAEELATDLGVPLVRPTDLAALLDGVDAVIPAPGLADHHPLFDAARSAGVRMISEFDLAQAWDERPIVAITGTNGKTTVTTLVVDMLNRSGLRAVDAGNTETPLVAAIEDPAVEVFVVEASSFRLGHSAAFSPNVATWLNYAPDHLDVHGSLEAYEGSKASMWDHLPPGGTAIANRDDPVVMSHSPAGATITFGLSDPGAAGGYCERDGVLYDGAGDPLIDVESIPRHLPHDRSNALAAAATALAAGADRTAVAASLTAFRGLPHRVQFVSEANGVEWFDDSKSTAPHSVAAAVEGFESVVLVCGGRNKGLDLAPLADLVPPVRAVVAIGEAAAEVTDVFEATDVAVETASSMDAAVEAAARLSVTGDAVLLSPGCASFDWYSSYAERGNDFIRAVRVALDPGPGPGRSPEPGPAQGGAAS